MPRLILNADDFGYTPGVNRAVVELHQAGILTSTTLMATGDFTAQAIQEVHFLESKGASQGSSHGARLGVGCHVVLVDGCPASPPGEVPTLLAFGNDPTPRFRPTLGAFISHLLQRHIREEEIEREAIAQIRLLQQKGVFVTHLDTHKHTHMFSGVLRPLLRAALACGVRAIRNPFEPSWSIGATRRAPLVRQAEVRLLAKLRPTFLRLVAQAGLRTTDGALGILATGTLDQPTLEDLLHAAAGQPRVFEREPVWELVCHPGYHDQDLSQQNTRLLSSRETERATLSAAGPLLKNFTLTHFGNL
jgi:predicted glycoside hydrolase/deacetylase ChbG (UPF0249 family)